MRDGGGAEVGGLEVRRHVVSMRIVATSLTLLDAGERAEAERWLAGLEPAVRRSLEDVRVDITVDVGRDGLVHHVQIEAELAPYLEAYTVAVPPRGARRMLADLSTVVTELVLTDLGQPVTIDLPPV